MRISWDNSLEKRWKWDIPGYPWDQCRGIPTYPDSDLYPLIQSYTLKGYPWISHYKNLIPIYTGISLDKSHVGVIPGYLGISLDMAGCLFFQMSSPLDNLACLGLYQVVPMPLSYLAGTYTRLDMIFWPFSGIINIVSMQFKSNFKW